MPAEEREISGNIPCLGTGGHTPRPFWRPLAPLGTPRDPLGPLGTPVETPPIGLAYWALVVAQHERRLDDVRQCGHLLVTEHPLEQREHPLGGGGKEKDHYNRYHQRNFEKYPQIPGKI